MSFVSFCRFLGSGGNCIRVIDTLTFNIMVSLSLTCWDQNQKNSKSKTVSMFVASMWVISSRPTYLAISYIWFGSGQWNVAGCMSSADLYKDTELLVEFVWVWLFTKACLPAVRSTKVSRQTFPNRFHSFDLNTRRLLLVISLTPSHRRQRLRGDKTMWPGRCSTDLPSCSLMSVGSPCTEILVVSVAGEGAVSDTPWSTWSP